MAKRWTLAVLVALAGTAQAQEPSPMGGAGPPMPVAASVMPTMGQAAGGPGSSGHYPGPQSPILLPAWDVNAWNDDPHRSCVEGWYTGAGFMALFRPALGHSVLAFRDPNGNQDLPIQPPASSKIAIDFNDLDPRPLFGASGTVGYRYNGYAIELTGFYMFHTETSVTATEQGRLDVPFYGFVPPVGFAGDNNLWLNADRVVARYHADFGNVEFNYRISNSWGIEAILGVRYIDYKDFFGILTDDDGIRLGAAGAGNIADYRVTSHSHFIAPQLGVEAAFGCNDSFAVGLIAKGAWGINFNDVTVDLERGDGLFRQHAQRSQEIFSQLYQLGVFADLACCERIKLRLGYQMFLLSNFPEAHEQVDFNVRVNTTGQQRDQSLILYHGPMIELAIQF